MNIIKAVNNDLENCADIIYETELGRRYYPTKKLLLKEVYNGQINDEFYIVRSEEEIVGILWYQLKGIFHAFPYLHMIVVKKEFQNRGIGKRLLDFFEKAVLEEGESQIKTKVFLTVGDFNNKAESIYIHRGYKKICELDGLFRKNITEKLYMKTVLNDK